MIIGLLLDPEIWGKAGLAGLTLLSLLIVVGVFVRSSFRTSQVFVQSLKEHRAESREERRDARIDSKATHDRLSSALEDLADSLRDQNREHNQ